MAYTDPFNYKTATSAILKKPMQDRSLTTNVETQKQSVLGSGATTIKTTAAGGAPTAASKTPQQQQQMATLVGPGGERVPVPVGSQQAQQYFGQGYKLETQAPGTLQPQQNQDQIAALQGKQYASGQNIVADGRMQSEVQFGAGEREIPLDQARAMGLIGQASSSATEPWKVTIENGQVKVYQPHGISSSAIPAEMQTQIAAMGGGAPVQAGQSLASQGKFLSPNQQGNADILAGKTPSQGTQQQAATGDRLLGPKEYEALRLENKVGDSNFDQFFRRDDKGNIYLKGNAAKGPSVSGTAAGAGATGPTSSTAGSSTTASLTAERQAILDALKMSGDEEAAQKALDALKVKEEALMVSRDFGLAEIDSQTIPMKLIMGGQRELRQQAENQLKALGVPQKTLTAQLALMQAKRKAALDSAKMMYDFTKEDREAAAAAEKARLQATKDARQAEIDSARLKLEEERVDISKGHLTIAQQKAAKAGTGKGGGGSGTDKEEAKFRADAAALVEKLDTGKVTWGTAFDQLKIKYPALSNEAINGVLGGSVDYSADTGEFSNPKGRGTKSSISGGGTTTINADGSVTMTK